METTEIRPGVYLTHHAKENCYGNFCPLHKVSDHPYNTLPQEWDQGIMWRVVSDTVRIPDPDDYKVRAGGYLLRNSAKCLLCDTEIESTHRHDFRSCPCNNVSVDGGHDYRRRGWDGRNGGEFVSWVDTSIVLD